MQLTAVQAIILGLVQGLTEFLPVSSSGHLVIVQSLMGLSGDMMSFDIFVHLGTLLAVFTAYWADIKKLLKKPFCRFTGMVLVACIPTGLMGVLLDDVFTGLFSSVITVACFLVITGILLLISDRFQGSKTVEQMSVFDALVVGTLQGVAIAPGLSRSGTTIFGSLTRGLKRSEAAKFSFIVSIPVILGAALLDLLDMSAQSIQGTYILGAVVAAISGFVAIRFFIKLLEKRSMRYFSYYVWLLAAAIIISHFAGYVW